MKKQFIRVSVLAAAVMAGTSLVRAADPVVATTSIAPQVVQASPLTGKQIFDQAAKSLVVVQYTYDGEAGRRELSGLGIVIRESGTVIAPYGLIPPQIPNSAIKDVKVIIPGDEEQEFEATLTARDLRSDLIVIQTKKAQKWTALDFNPGACDVGDTLYSVGLLPKDGGYKAYLLGSQVATPVRGPVPMILVGGAGLGCVGSPVFNARGEAIGLVSPQQGHNPFLSNANFSSVTNPPKLFVPASDFAFAVGESWDAGKAPRGSWIAATLAPVSKDVAEFFSLKGVPVAQVGDVIPGGVADKAGLKAGDKVVKLNGKALERGDEADETPQILTRSLRRVKSGQEVTFSVIREKGEKPQDIKVKVESLPIQEWEVGRFYAEDLGFSTRPIVFVDTYVRKVAQDRKGVVISFIRPSSSAATARLAGGDLVTELNGKEVANLDDFRTSYEAFRKDKPKEAVVLVVLRQGATEVIRIEPPQ